MGHPRNGCVRRIGRGFRLIGKLLEGLLLTWRVFPRLTPPQQAVLIQRWCRDVLDVLSIRLTLDGEVPSGRVSCAMFVANHISWVDVLLMNACHPVHFVAKSEVRQWPIIGWMAAGIGTLFLKRNSSRGLSRVKKSVDAVLRSGECVAHFPEGTTTDGRSVCSFHSGLFQSAVDAEAFIWPVGISYRRPDGGYDEDIAFIGSQSLVSSVLHLLAQPATEARLWFANPIRSAGGDRRALAIHCHQVIEQSLTNLFPFPVHSKTVHTIPWACLSLR